MSDSAPNPFSSRRSEPTFLARLKSDLEREAEYLSERLQKSGLPAGEEHDIQGALAFLREKINRIKAALLWIDYGEWEADAEIDYYFLLQLSYTTLQSYIIAAERLEIMVSQSRKLLERWESCGVGEIKQLRKRVLRRLQEITRAGDALQRDVATMVRFMEARSAPGNGCRCRLPNINIKKKLKKLDLLSTEALHMTETFPHLFIDRPADPRSPFGAEQNL